DLVPAARAGPRRPGPDRRPGGGAPPRCLFLNQCRCLKWKGSPSGSAASRPWTASPSPWPMGSGWASSVPTGAARAPSSPCSRGWNGPTEAKSGSLAGHWSGCRRTRSPASVWSGASRSPGSSAAWMGSRTCWWLRAFEAAGNRAELLAYDPDQGDYAAEVNELARRLRQLGVEQTAVMLVAFQPDGLNILGHARLNPTLRQARWYGSKDAFSPTFFPPHA